MMDPYELLLDLFPEQRYASLREVLPSSAD